MTVRYEVKRCTTCPPAAAGVHWIVSVPGEEPLGAETFEIAMQVVARCEVARLAGEDWTAKGDPLTGRVTLLRLGVVSGYDVPLHFGSWALAARFLLAWRGAGRALPVTAFSSASVVS